MPNDIQPPSDPPVRSSELVRLRKLKARLAAYMRWDKTDCNIFTRTRRHYWMSKDAAEIARLTQPNDRISDPAKRRVN